MIWAMLYPMTDNGERALLDLAPYEDRRAALELARHGCPTTYSDLARHHMKRSACLTPKFMLFGAIVSRVRGLHEAVLREIEVNNPHAVFPLLRAWLEVVTLAIYTVKKPAYLEFLLEGPGPNAQAKKSFEAMFHALTEEAAQLRLVYRQLSEYSHFGPLAVWNAYSVEDGESRAVSWTDVPRWRDERHFQIACAQAHELAIASLDYLNILGDVLIEEMPQPG